MELIEMLLLMAAAEEIERKGQIASATLQKLDILLRQKDPRPTERELLMKIDGLVAKDYLRKNGLVKYEITGEGHLALHCGARMLTKISNAVLYGGTL
jgi:hypothetical protein